MSVDSLLYDFMEKVSDDPRIGPAHISLFVAILNFWKLQAFASPVSVFGRDLRKFAKIGGNSLYHRCMRDLKEFGYIGYVPSFNPALGSLVYLF